jgi:hypothetical protein
VTRGWRKLHEDKIKEADKGRKCRADGRDYMVGEITFCKTKAIDGRKVKICVTEMGCGLASSYGSE